MKPLPITHITLYKHGVGYFERQAELSGEEVTLSFRVEDMNDVLKSLAVVDQGSGQVLGVDYATPQSREERLAGNSIRLDERRSLRDLLISLRGRRVRLLLDQEESIAGVLIGLDELPERQPLAQSPVSLLLDEGERVQTTPLGRVQGIELLDDQAASDLRFFLETARTEEAYRRVKIRLTPGEHNLSVSYVAPAPTWRVSYRLVADAEAEQALLQGWGIFDNRLEEDLEEVSLALVAGMPISFIYDLYTPFTPERPEIEEEARVAAGPVEFDRALEEPREGMAPPEAAGMRMSEAVPAAAPRAKARPAIDRESLRQAAPVDTEAEELGELFQYRIKTPVTVGRGQSAMVPILASDLSYRKELLYNDSKLPAHPVASLRMKNETGLTLERGPITVYESGEYVGEAILPFTSAGSEFVVPYAVELNVTVREEHGSSRQIHALHVEGAHVIVEEWRIQLREYRLSNAASDKFSVLVEHPRSAQYELFETVEAAETTDEHYRFAVDVPARGESTLRVKERRLLSRREALQRQSFEQWQRFLQAGLIDRGTHERVVALLRLWEEIGDLKRRLQEVEQRRDRVYRRQEQIQGNMEALSNSGREGELRARYVRQLEESETELTHLSQEESQARTTIQRLEDEISERLKGLGD
ncbi:MAG: hypothetical protein ACOC9C_01120 [Chloroflexota bacterium]